MIRILPVFLLIVAIASGARAESRAPNHLLGEDSPYLRQHLYNVVDWYPWGEEALSLAREQAKPIFLSIGYSSCHWCHVMEDESFEDDVIGAFLNDNFISIKIDRERRPDLDEQFMLVTEVLSGGGGWPNSVFLTSDGDPFFAGTYFPPDNFLRALNIINEAWREDRPEIIAGAQDLSIRLRAYFDATAAAAPSRSISG